MIRLATLSGAVAAAGVLLLAGCGGGDSSAPVTANPSATGTYTMADVAKHADASSCWTVIDKKVYDVTSWISQHPGGPDRIKGLCGKDGTAQFQGQHGGEGEPKERLATFQIGTLSG